jgi:tetratricopeptide (TPR) repeat protein
VKEGDSRNSAGDYEEAIKNYKKANELDPDNPQLHLKMYMAYTGFDKITEACEEMRIHFKLDANAAKDKRKRGWFKNNCGE